MRTVGLLGGMSWESTLSYYRLINEGVKTALGGLHSAQIVLYSVDFDPIEKLQHAGNWPATAAILSDAAKKIEAAGADFLLLCTNTMHKVAADIEHAITIPFLHIADATARQLLQDGVDTVGLLGTAFTMEEDFYKGRLMERHRLNVIVPDNDARQLIHRVIYQELCLGQIRDDSRQRFLAIVDTLQQQGAQAIILGCTEIGLLITQDHTAIPLYDTTAIHAAATVKMAIATT